MKPGNRGFTLLEMMVSLAVFSVIMMLTGMILQGGESQVRLSEIKMNLQESAREGLYRMGLEIRESSPSRVSVINNGTTLIFQIPASVSDSGVITWSNPVTYQRGGNGNQLIRIDGGTGQTSVLANDIQNVTFSATGAPPSTIIFSVTAQRAMINGRVLSVTSTGEARLRNP